MGIVSFSPPKAVITGTGFSVPDNVITNKFFSNYLDTNDEWIVDRTGIKERRWAEPGVTASELSLPACKQALEKAAITANEVDGIIVATCTPDYIFPSTACVLQGKLGVPGGLAFDLNAVCSGFVYALSVASALMATDAYRHILVVGVDLFSKVVDRQDRSTCILFGDGSGAVVLSRADLVKNGAGRGILSYDLGADGKLGDLLYVRGKGHCAPDPTSDESPYLHMNGREIFKLAVRSGVECGETLCRAAGVPVSELDFLAFHQANQRILAAVGRQLRLEDQKVLSNVDRFGNTSAASIPVLMAEAVNQGTVKPGQLILMIAFGGGVTWGGLLIRL